jgi:ribosomal protein S18 acetylase RimI-like enzyme
MPTKVPFSSRPATEDRDFDAMYDLAAAAPNDVLHLADLPWRFSSPSARIPERTRLWEDAGGTLVAWAVLQFPAWHCLDYAINPDARSANLESAVLAWATAALAIEASARGSRLPFYASARADDSVRIAAIERAGFTLQDWGYVRLIRDLDQQIAAPELPEGFTVRPLTGDREVEAYVDLHRAAFETANMTAEWRRATLRDPRYVPELDLVAVDPGGAPVGFCIGWITPPLTVLGGRRFAQVEPLGILPDFQRLGLGRALLLELLRRAKAHGASRIEVYSESRNAASRGAYEAVGFHPAWDAQFFLRVFGG